MDVTLNIISSELFSVIHKSKYNYYQQVIDNAAPSINWDTLRNRTLHTARHAWVGWTGQLHRSMGQ